jgi:hypothetical protein
MTAIAIGLRRKGCGVWRCSVSYGCLGWVRCRSCGGLHARLTASVGVRSDRKRIAEVCTSSALPMCSVPKGEIGSGVRAHESDAEGPPACLIRSHQAGRPVSLGPRRRRRRQHVSGIVSLVAAGRAAGDGCVEAGAVDCVAAVLGAQVAAQRGWRGGVVRERCGEAVGQGGVKAEVRTSGAACVSQSCALHALWRAGCIHALNTHAPPQGSAAKRRRWHLRTHPSEQVLCQVGTHLPALHWSPRVQKLSARGIAWRGRRGGSGHVRERPPDTSGARCNSQQQGPGRNRTR